MTGLTELTVVGETGQIRIQLENSHELTISDILTATAPACTGIPAASVDEAIGAGHLQLLDGNRELTADQSAQVIDNNPVTIKLVSDQPPRPRVLRAAAPPSASLPAAQPDPSPAVSPAAETTAPMAERPPVKPAAMPDAEGPRAVSLPARAGAFGRLATAYRALTDGSPHVNGLPAPPALTRARHAWRHSDYLDTLIRGIAQPQLTQAAVLAFLSSKGGVGKTTNAKLVAMAFAEARRDRCVLIDANPDRGTLGTTFARGHTVCVDDVHAAADRPDLSPSDLDAMLATGPHGLRVLPAPQNSSRRRKLGEDAYAAVIGCLRRHVGIVVIDLGTDMLEGPTVAALKAAHQLIVVSDDDWIAGEQTAASFWDDVRAITRAEYTIIANDITGSHAAVARRLHEQMTGAEGADSSPRSVTVVAHSTTGGDKLQDRRVEWPDLPRQWRRAGRELAYRLAQDWPRLGLARQP
jgi:MinD-like ATPase involved in chromosome partitioning or flagellar assembly